jgi:hypothetical protein
MNQNDLLKCILEITELRISEMQEDVIDLKILLITDSEKNIAVSVSQDHKAVKY